MIQIDIDVCKNHCSVKHLNAVTSGCVNTVICNFEFGDDWSSYTKIASFERDGITYHAQILDNHCIVPNAAINSSGVFSVGIVGIDSDNDRTVTTNLLNIRIIDGADKFGELDPDYSPTFLENVVSVLNDTKLIAQSVRADADAGKFDGAQGRQGIQGENGDKGDKGDTGATGADGKSAYELALDNGFVGTMTEWFASLVGAKGEKGDKGDKGDTGSTGADGYTPVRGTDYWNDADKAEIKSYVDAAILGGAW